MTAMFRFLCLAGVLMLAACASTTPPINAPATSWNLPDVSVRFGPEVSRTADGNTFSDNFVWNGLHDGNKKRQVIEMFKNAMRELAMDSMNGPRAVNMNVQVNYFHALTDFSRLWCCGEHRIYADLAVTDAESGEVLVEGENVYLGRVALGGIPGLVAEAAGRDQYTRVKEGIVKRTGAWLGTR